MPFAKLDANFAGSSLLAQGGLELAGFWAVLLSKKDRAGEVHDSLPKLAHDCYTTKDRICELLDVLAAPDPDSRTPDHDGQRIRVDREPRWCVTILNADRYREKDATAAERMRKYRAAKKAVGTVTDVTPVTTATDRSSASDSLSNSVSGSESVEEINASVAGREAGDEATSGDSDDERGRNRSSDGPSGEGLHGSKERLAGLRGDSRGRRSVSRGEAGLESGVHVRPAETHGEYPPAFRYSRSSGSSQGSVDPRSDEDRIKGSNFRAAADLDAKIFKACRVLMAKTGDPFWKVCRQVTSYRKPDGEMSAGVEDPGRLGSVLAREKALEDAEAWIEHLDAGKGES